MADEEQPQAADEAPAKSKRSLVLLLVPAILLAGIGAIGIYLLTADDDDPASAQAQEGDIEAPADDGTFGPLVDLVPLVCNLSDANGIRYVKVTVSLQVTEDAQVEAVTIGTPAIRSAMLVYFSDVRVESTLGSENKERIREELRDLVNRVMRAPMVTEVYFNEFVVQ